MLSILTTPLKISRSVVAAIVDDEDIPPPLSTASVEASLQAVAKSIVVETIQKIRISIDGTKANGDPWDSAKITYAEGKIDELYRLRYTFNGTIDGLRDEVDRIYQDVVNNNPDLAFNYTLQHTGYTLPEGTVF